MSELRDQDNVEVVHEESDVNVGAILRYGVGLVVIAAIVHLFLWWLLGVYQTPATSARRRRRIRWPPVSRIGFRRSPEFQENPQQELQDLRAKQKALLEGYGWVNKEAGMARIPIEEAMKMVVERGLPVREAAK